MISSLQKFLSQHDHSLLACVAALLDGGCNPSLPNLSGHKPIDYANSDAMKKLLESYIVKVAAIFVIQLFK